MVVQFAGMDIVNWRRTGSLAFALVLAAGAGACKNADEQPSPAPDRGEPQPTSPAATATPPAPASEASGNPHAIDDSADVTKHHCYAAFPKPQRCTEGFARVTACKDESEATLLRGGLKAVEDEGCYYFCPDVPNCATLTMDEVAALACKFAAGNGIESPLSLRSVCGPET
ncbi:MAG: hypothetical protein KC468_03230, partial [Myxococcales bacterium]|nr:hypothetical protein [Myxococcales bacterium]